MDPNPVAEFGRWIQRHVRKQADLFPEHTMVPDKVAPLEHRTRADPNALAEYAKGSDVCRRIDYRRGRNHRARMDTGREGWFGEEKGQNLGKGNPRTGDADEDFAAGAIGAVDKDGRRRALLGPGEVTFVFGKGEVPGLCAISGSKALQNQGWVSDDLSSEMFGDFSDA